jgi:hypothetical protein
LIAMAIGDGDDYVVSGDAGGLVETVSKPL